MAEHERSSKNFEKTYEICNRFQLCMGYQQSEPMQNCQTATFSFEAVSLDIGILWRQKSLCLENEQLVCDRSRLCARLDMFLICYHVFPRPRMKVDFVVEKIPRVIPKMKFSEVLYFCDNIRQHGVVPVKMIFSSTHFTIPTVIWLVYATGWKFEFDAFLR